MFNLERTSFIAELMGQLTDDVIWLRWRQGWDTLDIARHYFVHESEVYNRLLHVREARR